MEDFIEAFKVTCFTIKKNDAAQGLAGIRAVDKIVMMAITQNYFIQNSKKIVAMQSFLF
ncbi:MAG: hypothetical protein KC469_07025 [Flavobacteriaceae bacterium]|nr:hypothetical protein [Flavobacteriaceae bacterium]